MPFTPEQQREHRRKLKAKGFCTVCHTNKADHSASICEECWGKQMARRKKRMDEGVLCKYCAKPIFRNKMCFKCYCSNIELRRRSRKRRVENGLCSVCGNPVEDDRFTHCVNCQERNSEYRRLRKSWV